MILSTLINVLRIFSLFKSRSRVGIGSIVISKKNRLKIIKCYKLNLIITFK